MGRLVSWLGQLLFGGLCAAGLFSGGFLLLCVLGVVSPAVLLSHGAADVPEGQEESVTASAPAVLPETEEAPFSGCYLPVSALRQENPLPADCTAVLLAMKTADGALGYVSSLTQALDWHASWGDLQQNEALRRLNARPNLHTAALVSCLRDGLATQNPQMTLLRPSGSPWLDETGAAWLDPTKPEVQQYVIGVCRELAGLGFDEIVLTHCAYPPTALLQGEEAQTRAAALEVFCRQLQGALADLPVSLSILAEEDVWEEASQSGQTAALLASFPGRVWSRAESAPSLAAFAPSVLPVEAGTNW